MGVPPLGDRAEKGSGPWAKADAGEVSVHRELLSLPSQCPGEPAKGSVSRRGDRAFPLAFWEEGPEGAYLERARGPSAVIQKRGR